MNYGFKKELDMPYEDAVEAVKEALGEEGFGILTTIDIKDKLKKKLGVEFEKYVILGACHPPSAHKSLLVEEDIGLMLPCNAIVYERGEGSVVAAVKPTQAMSMIDNPTLRDIAGDVEAKLEKVMEKL